MKHSIILSIALSVLALASCEKNYYDIDIYQQAPKPKQDTTLAPQMVGATNGSGSGDLGAVYKNQTTQKIASYTYIMFTGFPQQKSSGTNSGYYKTVIKNGNGVDFLTNVTTFCTGNSTRDAQYIIKFRNMGLLYSDDMNQGAGGDYIRIGFQGQKANTSDFEYSDNQYDERQDESKVITGLRLVVGEGADTITDEYGIKWHKASSYYGSTNMNSAAGGKTLYFYYTKDYTGEQITLVNPYFTENYDRLKDNILMTTLFGGLVTWRGGDSNSWRPDVDALLTGLTAKLPLDDYYNDDARAIMRNVEFVRLYDTNMDPVQGDQQYKAANWNMNAGGSKEFLSYSYIEPSSPYWINQD